MKEIKLPNSSEIVTSPPVFEKGRIIQIEGYNFRVKAVKETGYLIEPFTPITCPSCGNIVKREYCGNCTRKIPKSPELKYIRKPLVRSNPKVGRNDLCGCGSGKRHKICCGKISK